MPSLGNWTENFKLPCIATCGVNISVTYIHIPESTRKIFRLDIGYGRHRDFKKTSMHEQNKNRGQMVVDEAAPSKGNWMYTQPTWLYYIRERLLTFDIGGKTSCLDGVGANINW